MTTATTNPYKLSSMQRCPYLHEMKERLLGEQLSSEPLSKPIIIPEPPPMIMDQPVGTVVKCNPDGYGSHTSPTHQRTPLMPRQHEDDYHYDYHYEASCRPKNAKTSLFIIMSFIYAKLLIVVCIAYVISDVVTHNLPLYYYEGFFTYLYGMSILFLLYVFCFLLQESSCCGGSDSSEKKEKIKKEKATKEKAKKEAKEKKEKEKAEKKAKEKEKKDKEKEKKEKEKDKKEKEKAEKGKDKKQQLQREVLPRKMRDVVQQRAASPLRQSTYRRNSEGVVDAGLADVPLPIAEIGALSDPVIPQEPANVPPPAPASAPASVPAPVSVPATVQDVEAGVVAVKSDKNSGGPCQRKRKTTQNDQSHGSFFLRIGAIAFGLGTMIYNGLEFGAFFEVPPTSPCYQVLRGVNPVLQMVFTFMQMYFIFMNSRLNIHRFKVIARFGLMHVVATNICVWIRTLVLEYLKEITRYHKTNPAPEDGILAESIRQHTLRNAGAVLGTHNAVPDVAPTFAALTTTTVASTIRSVATSTARTAATTLQSVSSTLPTTPSFQKFAEEPSNAIMNGSTFLEDIIPAALTQQLEPYNGTDNVTTALSCGRINIMGSIVQDSAPYLFPFIIEYSLIGAAVIYVMWKHIGRNPRYVTEEDLEHRLEVMLSRRAVAMAHAQHHGRVDCVGASKGLFFGLLMLVGSLICLILFFVLIRHPNLYLLAIYLADVSHCVLMALSVIAIIVGFISTRKLRSDYHCRVQSLKFRTEEQSDLNDILLRVSAFGLFIYAVFSVIAGSLSAFTKEPNLLVMITGILSIAQVILQLLFIADVSRRRVHLPEHDRSKPGRQVVTFLLICNVTMWIIYTFEMQKVEANPVQLDFYGFLAWAIVQRVTLPLCIFHRFHSAVTLAEIWKTSYKARLE